jgi:nucleotide-binding universal stress UspA family protein
VSEEIAYYPIEKILLPTDGSEFSLRAASYASKIAKDHNAQVTVLHVIELYLETERPIEIDDLESAVIELRHEREIKGIAEDIVDRTRKFLIEEGVPCDVEYILSRHVSEMIIDFAEKNNFDLIIMGHKGLTGYRYTVLGSVAEKVSRHAPCPVLIVRQ